MPVQLAQVYYKGKVYTVDGQPWPTDPREQLRQFGGLSPAAVRPPGPYTSRAWSGVNGIGARIGTYSETTTTTVQPDLSGPLADAQSLILANVAQVAPYVMGIFAILVSARLAMKLIGQVTR